MTTPTQQKPTAMEQHNEQSAGNSAIEFEPWFRGEEYDRLTSHMEALRKVIETSTVLERHAAGQEHLDTYFVGWASIIEEDLTTIRLGMNQSHRLAAGSVNSSQTFKRQAGCIAADHPASEKDLTRLQTIERDFEDLLERRTCASQSCYHMAMFATYMAVNWFGLGWLAAHFGVSHVWVKRLMVVVILNWLILACGVDA